VAALAVGSYWLWHPWRNASSGLEPSAVITPAIPEKSVAVLLFENLSSDKEKALFADGVQDEVLT
jgi:TolB-like protein